MRIGIEAQRIFRPKKHGMDIVALEVIKELQLLNTTHEFVVFVKDGADKCLKESHNLQIVIVPGKTYVDWEQWHLPKAVKAAKVDVLHTTSNTAPFRVGVPTVITLHDIIYLEKLQFTGTAYQNLGNIYRRLNVPFVVPRAEAVITVSNFEKDRILSQMSLSRDKVHVIHNGLSKAFKQIPKNSLEHFGNDKKLPERFILSLGNKAPKKNMKGSIKAYLEYRKRSINPMKMVLVECDGNYLKQTLAELNASEQRSHFVLTGYLPNYQLPLLYNLADVFLYPSYRESFGIPILEAQACGTPVITSNTSSMPEVAGDAAIFIKPESPTSIAEALLKLERDNCLRENLISTGHKNAAQYTWRNTAIRTLELYNHLNKNQ